jgi:dTDP-4-amino-4,6-dideoxygalactose transaminase
VLLIEDVAHAVGGEYGLRKCGTIGDIGCFSFFSNKNLSVGEGGMLVSANEEIIRQARLLRSHGMTSLTYSRHQGQAKSYDVLRPGLNYRLDETRAAIGIVQLAKLDANNARRKGIVARYHQALADLPFIKIPWRTVPENISSSYHIFPVLLPVGTDRASIMDFLGAKGIQTSIHYPDFARFAGYRDFFTDSLEVAGEISARCLTLPLYPAMPAEDVDYVVRCLAEYFDKQGETS